MQIIGGHSRFETFANYALRNGPVAAGRIAPESSNFKGIVSLAHPLKKAEQFLMSALKCGGGEIAKTPIFNKK